MFRLTSEVAKSAQKPRQMPWDLRFDPELRIVETRYAGRVEPNELRAAATATLACGEEQGTHRYLADCTALEGGHSVLDLYALVEILSDVRPTAFREAILLPQLAAPRQEVDFWETSCANRGFVVRIFDGREPAVAWLIGSPPDAS